MACTGITHISEDSSEIAFLLVENYQLTALVGVRFGEEFLNQHHLFISRPRLNREVLEKSERMAAAAVTGTTRDS
ncbi:hypothetical protein B0A55_12789, partial [Friedmanniomyces simplex]